MFDLIRRRLSAFFSKPIVQAGVKAGASMYAGPAGVKAVEILGPKVLDAIEPEVKK